MSKPWHDYPDQFRSAVIKAYKAGRTEVVFEFSGAAYSFRTRVMWMQRNISQQDDAPQDLREACQRVRWTGPRLNEYGTWTLVGTTEPKPGLSDADVIKAMGTP